MVTRNSGWLSATIIAADLKNLSDDGLIKVYWSTKVDGDKLVAYATLITCAYKYRIDITSGFESFQSGIQLVTLPIYLPDGTHIYVWFDTLPGYYLECIAHDARQKVGTRDYITGLYVVDTQADQSPFVEAPVVVTSYLRFGVNLWVYPDNLSFPNLTPPVSQYVVRPPIPSDNYRTYVNWWDYPVYVLIVDFTAPGVGILDGNGAVYQAGACAHVNLIITPIAGEGCLYREQSNTRYIPLLMTTSESPSFTYQPFLPIQIAVFPQQLPQNTPIIYRQRYVASCVGQLAAAVGATTGGQIKSGDNVFTYRIDTVYTDVDHSSATLST